MKKRKSKYLNLVANQATATVAWMWASAILGAVLIIGLYQYTSLAASKPTYLIPYNFATSTEKVKVSPAEIVDPQYLTLVGVGDLKLILDWTPDTVSKQYSRFLKRVSSRLYGELSVKLLQEADEHAKSGVSQVFFPNKTTVENGTTVVVEGRLVQFQGEIPVLDMTTVYRVTYELVNGMLRIVDMRVK